MNWLEYLITLHADKDAAYGDAWCRRGEAAGIFPNIARKYDRWQRITAEITSPESDPAAADRVVVEPLDDTLADLCIYAVKYLVWLLDRHTGLTRPDNATDALDTVDTGLRAVAATPASTDPAATLRSAFLALEQTFLRSPPHDPAAVTALAARRAQYSWHLAQSAFALLLPLPVPRAQLDSADRQAAAASGAAPPFPAPMPDVAVDLLRQLLPHVARNPGRILLVGHTPDALHLAANLRGLGVDPSMIAVADPHIPLVSGTSTLAWADVGSYEPAHVVICSDPDKEALLRAYQTMLPPDSPLPTVVLSGMSHLTYRDTGYLSSDAPALVPSYATGYPNTRIHMFEHLQAAARVGLRGAIVEFGAFKGGTTAWLARTARQLGLDVPVLALDSWDGFPPQRSLLDLYEHPRCVFRDLPAVRDYLEPLGVRLIEGDISETARQLAGIPVLLGFIDTDNYSPAKAALAAIVDNVIPGGAIVFDHYTTSHDYLYTLGERMAAQEVLADRPFLHLNDTGVFVRLPEHGARPAAPPTAH